jgi:PAS domain S-box-containing protein
MTARSKHTILLLDDDPGILRLGRRALERVGHTVLTAESTDHADVVLDSDLPASDGIRRGVDLIVLDYQLTGAATGLDYFRRRAAGGGAPPAILVTGFSDERRVLEALRSGVRDVVRKTDDFLEALIRTVERVLREVEAERQLVETEALRESEHRLRLALEAGRLGSWEVQIGSTAVQASPTCRSHFGLAADNASETVDLRTLAARIHPDDRDRAEQDFRQIISSTGEGDVEFRTLLPDGQIRWVAARGRVISSGPRRSPRLIGVTLDFTARKQAEQELEAARDAAEAASRAKDHFLAVLSHELRTPLTPVLATVHELTGDPLLSPRAREALEMIRRNVELETKLVDDLLDLTRISKGKLSLTIRPTDLHDALRAVTRMCEGEIKGKGLRLTMDLQATRHWVPADPARIQQVFWNLLKNAAKFTPEGGSIELRTEDTPSGRVRVQVKDNGIGIPPDLLPRIFDAFEQGEGAVTRKFGGLGLGLAITRALVQLHGGSIYVHSDGKGYGAEFAVELTTHTPAPTPIAGIPTRDSTPVPSAAIAAKLAVLLVEDHPDTAHALARMLTLFGHDVQVADSVGSAVQAIESHPFDVVVSDIGLPDGSGLDLMRDVRRRHEIRGVVLSGFGMEEDVRRSLDAGFSMHLTKPVTPDELNDAIVRVAAEAVD